MKSRKIFLWIFAAFVAAILIMNLCDFVAGGFFSPMGVAAGSLYVTAVFYITVRLGKCRIKTPMLLFLIIALGFALRVGYAIFSDTVPLSDYRTMFSAAEAIAEGKSPFTLNSYFHKFPHITFFPYICGLIFRLTGANLFIIKIINSALSAVCIYLIYITGKKLWDEKTGQRAAFLFAMFPPYIMYCSVFACENFAMPFFILSLYLFVSAQKSRFLSGKLGYMTVCGIALAVGGLFRSSYPFYIVAYIFGIIFVFPPKTRIIPAVSFLVSFFMVTQAVSVSLEKTGVTQYSFGDGGVPHIIYILEGFNFDTGGMYSEEDHNIYYENRGDKAKIKREAAGRLFERISENPEKIIPLMIRKTYAIYGKGDFDAAFWSCRNNGVADIAECISSMFFIMLLALIFIMVLRNGSSPQLCMLAFVVLGFEAGLMLMEVQARYTFSAAFVFALTAAYKDY